MSKLTNTQIDQLHTLLLSADKDDLNMIARMHKHAWGKLHVQAIGAFKKGDKVQFTTRKGEVIKGKVDKVNRKNVKLTATDGVNWSVTATLLTATK